MALSVDGRKKVKTLKEEFKNEFGVSIRVYKGVKFADENATLASIRKEGAAKTGELKIVISSIEQESNYCLQESHRLLQFELLYRDFRKIAFLHCQL